MAFKILSRSQLVALIPFWKAPETISKLQPAISSTAGSWSLFRSLTRLFNTAQLALCPFMDNWIFYRNFLQEESYQSRDNQGFEHWILKETVSQSNKLMQWRCWRPNNRPGHPLLILKYSIHWFIKANCIKRLSYNILYKLIFYKR